MTQWYDDPVGMEIVKKKYLHEDEKTFEDLVGRISACFSKGLQDKIKTALLNADFFPAGRSLYALGCKGKFSATTSNCYILPSPEDNLSSIFDVGKAMAIIFSKGGGCGINLSKLRPRGAKVRNMAQIATGAVSFMDFYNAVGSIISQSGRRGALLIGLNSDHPDVEEFLKIKQNNERIQSANISILFDDAFMQAMEAGNTYQLTFDVQSSGEKIRRQINAEEFFRKFCAANKDYAEPGAIFLSRVRCWSLLSSDPGYRIEIANPCGEFYGNAFSACNLGSCNVYGLILNKFTKRAILDKGLLRERVNMAVEALDEILDYGFELQPLD
jgi:ribonucleoside-diphosphate reductase alpha chain